MPSLSVSWFVQSRFTFGLKSDAISSEVMGVGVSIKLADGTNGMWPMIIAAVLRELGYKNDETYAMLEDMCHATIVNDNGDAAGMRRPVFVPEYD